MTSNITKTGHVVNKGKKRIAFLLLLFLVISLLPPLTGIMDLKALGFADPTWTPGPGEVLVTSQAEFASALTGNAYHTIYLGADISQPAVNLNGTGRPGLTINGTDPKTDITYTLTMTAPMQVRTTGRITDLTFKDIRLRQPTQTGGIVTAQALATSNGVTVTFENADIEVYRNILAANMELAAVKIIDSYLVSTNSNTARLFYTGSVEFFGEVTINAASGGYGIFQMNQTSAPGTFSVATGADVRINSTGGQAQASLFNALSRVIMNIEKNANFSYTGGNLGYSYAAANTARSILVDRNATATFSLRGNRSRLRTASLTVNEGASLYLWASTSYVTNYRQAVYCPTMNLNSPFRVVFATGGTANNALFLPNTNFNAKDIKSIRYFTSGTSSFDGMMNYVGANRADYRNWWFQQNGLFNVSASNWSSITANYNPTANIIPGATLNFDSTNFNPAAIHAVQIDGGSRTPTIDTVYVGARVITGTGQPGADITVTWPTISDSGPSATPTTTVMVDIDGTFRAEVPEDIFLQISDVREETQIKATQRETLYGLDRGESYPVFAPIIGTAMKVIGNNARNIYYDKGAIPDTAEILFFGAGSTVELATGQGRYIITNSAVNSPDSSDGFEALWSTTGDAYKGYIDPNTGVYWRDDLCAIPANCTVWAMAEVKMGGVDMRLWDMLTYNNLFEKREIDLRLLEGLYTDPPGSHIEISPYTPIPGNYGIPYNLSGNILTGSAVRYSRVNIGLNSYMADYWTATTKNGSQTPITIVLDTGFPSDYLGLSDDAQGLNYTLYIQKVLDLWREVPMAYVDKEGLAIPDFTGEPASIWVPMDIMEDLKEYGDEEEPDPPQPDITSSDFLLRGGRYIPQKHYPYTPIGYYVSQYALDVRDDPEGNPDPLKICSDFSKDFNPEISNITLSPQEVFYIVFDEGITDVREVHKFIEDLGGDSIYPDRVSVAKIETDKPPVRYTAPRISGYVPVGWEIRNLLDSYSGEFVYNPLDPEHFATMDQNGNVFVDLTAEMIAVGFDPIAPEELEIVWIYAIDANNNGIPDEEETRIYVYWNGLFPGVDFPAQLNSTIFTTRIGHEFFISNDGSLTGDPEHKIVIDAGFAKGIWIFDSDIVDNEVVATITPLDSSPQIINFWYAFSSDGFRPDNQQYVDVYYILWDDDEGNGATAPQFMERKYALKGDILNYTPGDLSGYIYYGYQTDYEEDEGLVFSDYVNGAPAAEIAFYMHEYTHDLTLIFIKAGEPITIYWKGSTLSGNVVTLGQKELTGYWGESVTVERSSITTEAFWVPVAGENSIETFVLNATAGREHTFNFDEKRTSIIITVEGISTDGPLNYSYQQTISYPNPPYTVIPLEGFYGYKVIAYEVYDRYGFEITPYTPGNSVTVNPVLGEQTVTFYYASTITSLTIKAVEKDNPSNILLEKALTGLSIGQIYAAIAPFIDETWVLDGDVIRPITITTGANEVVFEYEKASGNLTVILREVESPGVPVDPENNIKVISKEYAADGVLTIPDLTADYYTAVDLSGIPITYSELPALINVDYTKDLVNVTIVPVDQASGIPIPGAATAAPPARKGEMFTATTASVPGYTLMEASSKEVYANPAFDPVEVEFAYKKDVTGKVTVINYYLEGTTKVYLSESVVEVPEGAKLTINAFDYAYPGFLFANKIYLGAPAVEYSGATIEITVSRVDADNLIEFLYTDVRKVVNVYNKLGANPAVEIAESPDKFVEGEPAIIYPLYQEGYILIGYAIDPDNLSDIAESEIREIESSFTGVDLGSITADYTVVFIYITEEEYFDSRISLITIEGRQGGALLYSYKRPVLRSNTEATLSVPEDVFEIPGFILEAGQDYTFVPNRDKTLRFNYLSLASAVRIRMVDSTDNDIIPGFYVAAITGGILTYNAPNLPGYYLTDAQSIQIADPVLADGESELLFHYAPLTPLSVTIVAKENDEFGRIIRVVEVPTPTPGNHTYPAPDLSADFYTPLASPNEVSINWDGLTSAAAEAYYTKDLVSIAVNKVDYLTGTPLEAAGSVGGRRQGEATTIAAPILSGYVLVGSANQTVVADSGAEVTFSYRTLAGNEVQVIALDKVTGAVLQNYVLTGTTGETLSVRAPLILGWLLDGTNIQNATIGTDPDVIFEYNKDVATITVHKIHLTDLVEIGSPLTIEVARGGNISVYAPHIEGYVIAGYDSLTQNEVTTDLELNFYYKTLSEAESEVYANITIRGINSSGLQLYRYTKLIERSLLPYTLIDGIDIFALPGYTLDPGQEHLILDSGSYTFSYTSTDGTVRISLEDESTGDLVGAGSFNVAATIGQPFSYYAPHVSGYKLVNTSSIGLIPQVLAGGLSEIVFKYAPITSMVIIVCKEESSMGRIIRVVEVKNPDIGISSSIAAPDLSAEFYTPIQDFVNYTFDGSNALELEAYYSKDLIDIPITAVDDLTSAITPPLGAQPALLNQRMGEVTTVTAPLISGYFLVGSNSRLVIVTGGGVEFRYRSTTITGVTVNVYAGSKTGPIIQSYVVPATSGEIVTIDPGAISIAGYSYDPGHPDNRLSWLTGDPGSGDGDDIRVIMSDNRAILNIQTKLGAAFPTAVSSELLATPYSKTVYAPYVNGWIVTGYQIDSESPVMTGIVTAVSLSAITASPTNLTFFYITEEEYIGDKFITLTVEGRSGSTVLYRYSKLVGVSDTEQSLAAPQDIFEVPGYILEEGQTYTFVPDRNRTLRFNYLSLATTVRIRMVDSADNDLTPGFDVAAITGSILTYNAPNLPGHYLTDPSSVGIANPVLADGESEILFHYAPIISPVTIVAKENDTSGRIIKIVEVTPPAPLSSQSYPAPDLTADFYTVVPGFENISIYWSGSSAASGEVYYTKNLVSVAVNKIDSATSAPLEAPGNVDNLRQGEAVTITAPILSEYVLLGSLNQTVVAQSGGSVTFSYRAQAEDEFQVRALARATGAVLQNYVLTGTVGEIFVARAPSILGWSLIGANSYNAKIGVDREVIFEYEKDVATLSVHKIDLSTRDEIGLPLTVEAARGGSITIYAPHVEGYVLFGYSSLTRSGVTADEDLYFFYKTLSEAEMENFANITIRGINTGGAQLYRYTKRIGRADLPYQLIEGIDIFALPGYILDPGQDHEVTAEGIYSFTYSSTDGTVTISLKDADSGEPVGAGSFNVAATIGQPFSYLAPNVLGYKLSSVSNIGTVVSVAADGSAEIVFDYTMISTKIRVEYREDTLTGTLIRVAEITNPATGTGIAYSPPATLPGYYTLMPADSTVYYNYDGTTEVTVIARYTKDLVAIPIRAVNDLNEDATPPLGAQPSLLNQRKGEVATVTAPVIEGYLPVGSNRRLVIALGATEEFRYRSTSSEDVIVNIYAGSKSGPLIQSYLIPALSGETVVIDPATISITGYTFDAGHPDNRLSWRSGDPERGDGIGIRVIMADRRATLNLMTKLGAAAATTFSSELLATPYSKTVYAPYLNGWVATGYQIESFAPVTTGNVTAAPLSAITADPTNLTFFYITEEEYILSRLINLTIEGRSGSSVLYSYTKPFSRTSASIALAVPQDVFELPGFILADGQTYTFVPDRDQTLIFNYVSLATTVKIRMVDDSDADIIPGFAVPATTGSILTYNAPNLNGYYLSDSSSIGRVDPVLANGASELLFHYQPIVSQVTIVAKENNANGRIIKIVEVAAPISGTHTYPAPDLSDDFYTPLASPNQVSITWNGSSVASGEAYYSKNLVNVAVNKIDSGSGDPIEEAGSVDGLRQGEAATISAPNLSGYVLVGSANQTVVADSGVEVTFSYRILAADEVKVNAVIKDTGVVLQSYVIKGRIGQTLTIKAPAILGWLLEGANSQDAQIGADREVTFEYEKDVAVITVRALHATTLAEIIPPAKIEVAKGGDITITAPHLAGYVIVGDSQKTLTGVVANNSVYFLYRRIEDIMSDYFVTLTVIGKSGPTELYRYQKIYAKGSGLVDVYAFNVRGYILTDPSVKSVDIQDNNDLLEFNYESRATTVRILMLDAADNEVAMPFDVGAEVGSPFTYNAPDVVGYYLTSSSTIGIVNPVAANGASEIVFRYARITSMLTIVAKENDPNGRVIKIVEIRDPVTGLHDYPAPDLSDDYYTPLADPNLVSINWDGVNSMFGEAYYSKDLVDITINKVKSADGAPLGTPDHLLAQRQGEAVTVGAPDITDMALDDDASKTVIALEATTVTFKYREIGDDEVVVKAIDKVNNVILLSYSMTGVIDDIITVYAPTILGWALSESESGNKSATIGANKEIRFEYEKNVVRVTINVVRSGSGNPIIPATVVEVPKGGDYIAYAPHIAGHILTDINKSKETFTDLVTDAEVTFRYSTLADLVTVVMHYLNTATNTAITGKSVDTIPDIFYVGQYFDSLQIAPATFVADGHKWDIDPTKPTRIILGDGINEINVYYADKGPTGGGGGGGAKTPATLIVRAKDVKTGDSIYEQTLPVYVGDSYTINAPVIEGYTLDASSSPSQTITISSTEQVLLFNYNYTGLPSSWPNVSDKIREILEVDDHIAYINGYPDKTIQPGGNITRAEVAMIFWRLLKTPSKNDPVSNKFSDVKSGVWYSQAINYLADMGILRGYPNGAYRPSQTITRAEFTAIISRFDDLVSGVANPFSDLTTSHWAYDSILSSYSKGWVKGYPSGIFLPQNKLTRTEAVTIINRMLGRILKKENVPQSLYNIYPDLPATHWGFADMIEASIVHEYEWENETEIWTSWK